MWQQWGRTVLHRHSSALCSPPCSAAGMGRESPGAVFGILQLGHPGHGGRVSKLRRETRENSCLIKCASGRELCGTGRAHQYGTQPTCRTPTPQANTGKLPRTRWAGGEQS